MKKELWLEFGYQGKDGWEDMYWYNEGNAIEIFYFMKEYSKNLFTPNRYFKMSFGKIVFYLRGYRR